MRNHLAIAALALSLAACDGNVTPAALAASNAKAPTATSPATPNAPGGQVAAPAGTPPGQPAKSTVNPDFKKSIEAAMLEVPIDMRPAFQRAFACRVKQIYADASAAKHEPPKIDAGTIRSLTAELKTNPALASC